MVLPDSVSAEDASTKTVRIGVFEETYNIVNEEGERSGMSLTDDVMTISILAVTAKGQFDESANNRVAIIGNDSGQKWYANYAYPNEELVTCASEKEAKKTDSAGQGRLHACQTWTGAQLY